MGQEGKSRLSQPSSSFRLRNRSLNSLRLRRIFDVFDGNGDGVITTPELSRALERLGLDADQAELGRAVECYIKPGKAGLEYDDFESLHRSLGDSLFAGGGESVVSGDEEVESELREAFKVFDEDGDGFISAVELQMVLGKLGLVEGKELEKVEQMINSVDRNRDGQVDFSEFTHMMQGISVQTS